MARHADWYFDFISPYAYLQFKHFHRLPTDFEITLRPVLFAIRFFWRSGVTNLGEWRIMVCRHIARVWKPACSGI